MTIATSPRLATSEQSFLGAHFAHIVAWEEHHRLTLKQRESQTAYYAAKQRGRTVFDAAGWRDAAGVWWQPNDREHFATAYAEMAS